MKNLDGQVLLVLVSPTIIARGCHASKWWASLLHVRDAGGPLYPWFQLSFVYRRTERIWEIKETVHMFQNVRQVRMGCNMVKSSSPNAPRTWLIFLCPRTLTSPQTCHHSASSILAVRISCWVIAVFVFRQQQEEWRSQWTPTIG